MADLTLLERMSGLCPVSCTVAIELYDKDTIRLRWNWPLRMRGRERSTEGLGVFISKYNFLKSGYVERMFPGIKFEIRKKLEMQVITAGMRKCFKK